MSYATRTRHLQPTRRGLSGCTAQFIQIAGIEALSGPQEQVELVVAEYQKRRDAIVGGLNSLLGSPASFRKAPSTYSPISRSTDIPILSSQTSSWIGQA